MNQQIDFTSFYGDDTDPAEKFEAFHKENPHVLKAIALKGMQLKRAGHKVAGMKMVFEVLRWDHMLTTSDEPFKLNNNNAPFYTRLIDEQYPELKGFFTRRTAQADDIKGAI